MTKKPEAADLGRLKRLAAQLLSQLPEDREEALIVIVMLRELVEWRPSIEAVVEPVLKIVG